MTSFSWNSDWRYHFSLSYTIQWSKHIRKILLYTFCYLENFLVTNIETQNLQDKNKFLSSDDAHPDVWMNRISCSISSHSKIEITILAWLLTVFSRQKHISLLILWYVHQFSKWCSKDYISKLFSNRDCINQYTI